MTAWLIDQAGRHATVVRLQTGDPASTGAHRDDPAAHRRRRRLGGGSGGVSSAMAAMAAAGETLTLPEVTQTVILTRVAGRTPMPGGKT